MNNTLQLQLDFSHAAFASKITICLPVAESFTATGTRLYYIRCSWILSFFRGNPRRDRRRPSPALKHPITLLYYNARSLYPKLDSLKAECLLHKPYIVCITETWLSDDISNHELHIPGYCVVRLDRSRHGGGVLMYISDLFTYNTVFVGNPPGSILPLGWRPIQV